MGLAPEQVDEPDADDDDYETDEFWAECARVARARLAEKKAAEEAKETDKQWEYMKQMARREAEANSVPEDSQEDVNSRAGCKQQRAAPLPQSDLHNPAHIATSSVTNTTPPPNTSFSAYSASSTSSNHGFHTLLQ